MQVQKRRPRNPRPLEERLSESWRALVKAERVRRGRDKNHPETKACWKGTVSALERGNDYKVAERLKKLVRREQPNSAVEIEVNLTRNVFLPIVQRWMQENKEMIAECLLAGSFSSSGER